MNYYDDNDDIKTMSSSSTREKTLYGQAASIVAELVFKCNWRIGLENVLSLLSNDNNIGS